MPHPTYCQRISSKRSKEIYTLIHKTIQKGKYYKDPKFTTQQLSALLNINTRYIAAVVQLNTNRNFNDLLNSFRMSEAEQMLLTAVEFSAEEIGLMSGFGSRQSFYRTFRKIHGITPRQFRMKQKMRVLTFSNTLPNKLQHKE